MRKLVLWLPLALFIGFVLTVSFGLKRPPSEPLKSQLVGKALPSFSLPPALPSRPGLNSASLASGRPRVINIFASWCIPCISEAPQLMALARAGVPIDAIAVRDRPEDIDAFLKRWGDPYRRIGADRSSQVQLALGSSGVPETFVVDGRGVIRHQHIGEIRPEHIAQILQAYESAK